MVVVGSYDINKEMALLSSSLMSWSLVTRTFNLLIGFSLRADGQTVSRNVERKRRCSFIRVAADNGSCSISITQRPPNQGRLRAEHEIVAASFIRSLTPSSIAQSPNGFECKIDRRKKHMMKRKQPCAEEVQSEKKL